MVSNSVDRRRNYIFSAYHAASFKTDSSLRNRYLTFVAMEMQDPEVFDMDEATRMKWYKIVFAIKKDFGKKPDLNGLLYLIGMREIGAVREFSKDEKMDMMHVATCALMSLEGIYELEKYDEDGWPHYIQKKQLPYGELHKQESFLRRLIVKYFEQNDLLEE